MSKRGRSSLRSPSSSLASQEDLEVTQAVESLRCQVRSIIHRYIKRREKLEKKTGKILPEISCERQRSIEHCLRHMKHCLTVIALKSKSLQTGIQCLRHQVWPEVLQSLSSRQKNQPSTKLSLNDLTVVLQHFFLQLLRLRDGLILLVSGECRHVGDIEQAVTMKRTYPSRLPDAGNCADGYTQLYSSSLIYSGAAWDEFMNDQKGLQERLLRELRPAVTSSLRDTLWDDLMENCPGLEMLLNQIEVRVQDSQQELKDFAKQVESDLKSALIQKYRSSSINVTLCSADKMEKLTVAIGATICKFERLADEFQVRGAAGVLPFGYGVSEWKRIMTLPVNISNDTYRSNSNALNETRHINMKCEKKKKRRVIIDSSDSDEVDVDNEKVHSKLLMAEKQKVNNAKNDTLLENKHLSSKPMSQNAGGLRVRVQEPKQQLSPKSLSATTESLSCSPLTLREIKQRMGVDVEGLAAARDCLEAEEAGSSRAAAVIDNAPVDSLNTTDQEYAIGQAERKAKRLKKELKRTIMHDDSDDDEVWNARERLREICMAAGNLLLWQETSTNDKVERLRALQKATDYFSASVELVTDQLALHEKMMMNEASGSEALRLFGRNLILLLGQAHANKGIAKVELSQRLGERDSERKVLLRDAIRELECAIDKSKDMLSRCQKGKGGEEANGDAEGAFDTLQAAGLRSLSNRWMGRALWNQGRRKDAQESFKRGGTMLCDDDAYNIPLAVNEDLLEAELEVWVDNYYSWTSMADLASLVLERAPQSSARDEPQKYEEVLSVVKLALDGAASVSKAIQVRASSARSTGERYENLCAEHSIECPEDLLSWWTKIKDWWAKKKSLPEKIRDLSGMSTAHLPRNDIVAEVYPKNTALPRRRLVITEGSLRRGRKKRQAGGYSIIGHSAEEPVSNSTERFQQPPRKYRKWGEELLPHTVNASGNIIPKLSYPSVAPEMPPAIKAIFEHL